MFVRIFKERPESVIDAPAPVKPLPEGVYICPEEDFYRQSWHHQAERIQKRRWGRLVIAHSTA
ncbi:MAG TPA: hypothetical protein VGH14_04590 [Solirubrobacterales bacterium]|jgi:hypothetical protein